MSEGLRFQKALTYDDDRDVTEVSKTFAAGSDSELLTETRGKGRFCNTGRHSNKTACCRSPATLPPPPPPLWSPSPRGTRRLSHSKGYGGDGGRRERTDGHRRSRNCRINCNRNKQNGCMHCKVFGWKNSHSRPNVPEKECNWNKND